MDLAVSVESAARQDDTEHKQQQMLIIEMAKYGKTKIFRHLTGLELDPRVLWVPLSGERKAGNNTTGGQGLLDAGQGFIWMREGGGWRISGLGQIDPGLK